MKAEERLKAVMRKVSRAQDHFLDLDARMGQFIASKPFEVGARPASGGKGVSYFISRIEPTPEIFQLLAGDAIQCLVTALDHLAYQLVCSNTNDAPEKPTQIYFPVANSAQEYNEMKRRKLWGAAPETFQAVDALKPYKGGNDDLWQLHQLNRIEKHRTLLTISAASRGVDLMSLFIGKMNGFPESTIKDAQGGLGKAFLKPACAVPMVLGGVILTDQTKNEHDPNLHFGFHIELAEPEVPMNGNMLNAITRFGRAVQDAISGTKHCLKDT